MATRKNNAPVQPQAVPLLQPGHRLFRRAQPEAHCARLSRAHHASRSRHRRGRRPGRGHAPIPLPRVVPVRLQARRRRDATRAPHRDRAGRHRGERAGQVPAIRRNVPQPHVPRDRHPPCPFLGGAGRSLDRTQRHPVADASIGHSLPDDEGILDTRLIHVDGTWYFPGNPAFYRPVVPTKRMLEMLCESVNPEERFIDPIRSRYGRKDYEGAGHPRRQRFPRMPERAIHCWKN